MRIKNFTQSGSFKDDKDILLIKDKYCNLIEDQMRAAGRVPVLNITPLWRTSWDADRQAYNFELTMFGVYVGKRKAETITGWDSAEDKWYDEPGAK